VFLQRKGIFAALHPNFCAPCANVCNSFWVAGLVCVRLLYSEFVPATAPIRAAYLKKVAGTAQVRRIPGNSLNSSKGDQYGLRLILTVSSGAILWPRNGHR
jgi:hypothetical protein